MINFCRLAIPMLCIALGSPTLHAGDLSSYRGMHFGMNLATAGKQRGPILPTAEVAYNSIYGETAPVVARWEDSEYSYNLVRSGDRSSFGMILYSKRLDALAQAATVESVRLETQEAPQRELEKQKKRDNDERLVLEKARSVNKPNFRP